MRVCIHFVAVISKAGYLGANKTRMVSAAIRGNSKTHRDGGGANANVQSGDEKLGEMWMSATVGVREICSTFR